MRIPGCCGRTEPIAACLRDATRLCHFALADRIDVLGSLLAGRECLTTAEVMEELEKEASKHRQLAVAANRAWLHIEGMKANIDRVTRFGKWMERIGNSPDRDIGEASVMALAEELGAVAVTDDEFAKRVALKHYDRVHGTLWLLAELWGERKVTEVEVCNPIDLLAASGMRLPCKGGEFARFAEQYKMGPFRR